MKDLDALETSITLNDADVVLSSPVQCRLHSQLLKYAGEGKHLFHRSMNCP